MKKDFKKTLNITLVLAKKQIKKQYRGSFLGVLWSVLFPLLNMLVLWFVFGNIFNITDPYYPLYILTGNVLFLSFSSCSLQALSSLVANKALLLRKKISPFIIPLSSVLSSFINFMFSLMALIPFMIWLSVTQNVNLFTYRLLYLFFLIPPFLLFQFGISLILSFLYVYFRDLKHLYSVMLMMWRYLTPIFYNMTKIKEGNTFYRVININPLYHFLNYFRDLIYRGAIGRDALDVHVPPFSPLFRELGILFAYAFISLSVGLLFYYLFKDRFIKKI